MTKRFIVQSDANADEIKLLIDREQMVMWSFLNHDEAVNHICDLLNELHEENQSLKFQLDECRNHKLFSRRELEKENEQLKEKLSAEKPILDYFHNRHFYIRDMTTEEIKEWNKTISKVM